MGFGCDCGATDCPRCYPGSRDWVGCDRCGEQHRRHELTYDGFDRYLCDDCVAEIEEEREAEEAGEGEE